MDLERYVRRARQTNRLEREILEEMARGVEGNERVLLVGWSDYAKHLVNLFPEKVIAIADDDRVGWTFRGKRTVSLDEGLSMQPGFIAITDLERRVDLVGRVAGHPLREEVPLGIYPGPHREDLRFYDPWRDDPLYRSIQPAIDRSMLNRRKALFLAECFRQTVALSGDVIEIGVWQGGSALILAEILRQAGITDKALLLFDLFELRDRAHPDGIMSLDEIRYLFEPYPWVGIHQGNVDLMAEVIAGRTYSFVHYDTEFSGTRMSWCFEGLVPGGIVLLDNFGHITANPRGAQDWFAVRGHVVGVTPFSEQGWVVRHTDVLR